MNDDFAPAIAVFERIIVEAERKAADARSAINALLAARGMSSRYADEGLAPSAATSPSAIPTQIKRDSFYGKKQMTAIREFLEMRRATGDGPATPREVVNALKAGGYHFQTKSDDIALVGVRALMRKSTTVFRKLPGTNTYGLAVWYPNSRPDDTADSAASRRSKISPAKVSARATRGAKAKPAVKPKRTAAAPQDKSAALAFVQEAIADGSEWTTERLRKEALSRGIAGITAATSKSTFHALLMTLKQRNHAVSLGNGVWKIAPPASPEADPRVVPMPVKGVG